MVINEYGKARPAGALDYLAAWFRTIVRAVQS